MSDLTSLLNKASSGELAAEELLTTIYAELRELAARYMAREAPGQTLQPTALVHEAWLRIGGVDQSWQNRAHFFGAAAEAMRRILIERARRRRAERHGGGLERVDIQEIEIEAPARDEELLAMDDALARLVIVDPQKAELVKLRYFAGLTLEEAAEILGISLSTAKRYWAYSRAWLFRELSKSQTTRADIL